MLVRWLAIAVLIAGLAAPAFAQQEAAAPEKVRAQIDAFMNQWIDAYNRGDGKTLAELTTPSAFAVGDRGVLSGSERIQRTVEDASARGGRVTRIGIDEVQMIGRNTVVAAGPYVATYANPRPLTIHGTWMQVLERRRGGWKSAAASYTPMNAATSPAAANPRPEAGSSAPPQGR